MAHVAPTLILSANYTRRSSDVQPLWHFVLLSIITFGLYHVYWFYRNFKYLKVYKNLEISPIMRTVGLYIPILGFFILYDILFKLRDFARDGGVYRLYTPGEIFVGYLISMALYKFLSDPYWIIGLLSGTAVLVMVQRTLNLFWEARQLCIPRRSNYHLFGEFIVAVVVAGLWFSLVDAIF